MWYVEHLLLNSERIKAKQDLESDEYVDLLDVERALEELTGNEISTNDRKVIDLIVQATSVLEAEERNGKDFIYYHNIFMDACSKIGERLQGVFTDIGYLTYLKETHNLTEEQLDTIHCFMVSKYRHKLLTKPYKKEN